MVPTSSALSGYDGKKFTLNSNLYEPQSDGAPIVKAFQADLVDSGGDLEMTASGSGTGFWVPYVETKPLSDSQPAR